jgi:hypothetical protein
MLGAALEGCAVDLAHPRIHATDYALAPTRDCHCKQRAHIRYRQTGGEGQTLSDTAGDTQAREGTGPGSEGNGIEGAKYDTGLAHETVDHGQDQFRMTVTGDLTRLRRHRAIVPSTTEEVRGGDVQDVEDGRPDAGAVTLEAGWPYALIMDWAR